MKLSATATSSPIVRSPDVAGALRTQNGSHSRCSTPSDRFSDSVSGERRFGGRGGERAGSPSLPRLHAAWTGCLGQGQV